MSVCTTVFDRIKRVPLCVLQGVVIAVCRIGNFLPDLHKSKLFRKVAKKAFDAVALVAAFCFPPILVCLLIDPVLSLCEKLNVGGAVDAAGNVACAVFKPFDAALFAPFAHVRIKKSLAYWERYERQLAEG